MIIPTEYYMNNLIDNLETTEEKQIALDNIFITTNYTENEIRIFSNKDDKAKNRYKTKNYIKFNKLVFGNPRAWDTKEYFITDKYFDFIKLIEILKAFGSNKLEKEKEYKIGECIAMRKQKNKIETLQLKFYKLNVYLDKIDCLSVATFLLKLNQNFNPIYQ
jgi:hypothetical protein